MRTTITFEPDIAAIVDEQRRAEGIGVSEAVNRLIRRGASQPSRKRAYVHRTAPLGIKVDITNIGEVLDMLDGE